MKICRLAQEIPADLMDALKQMHFLRGVSVQTEIRSGYAIDQICNAASQPDVDLIVISTHGRTGDSSMG